MDLRKFLLMKLKILQLNVRGGAVDDESMKHNTMKNGSSNNDNGMPHYGAGGF